MKELRAASQGAFAGGDIASDERNIAGHAANQRSEPGEAGVCGSIPQRSTISLDPLDRLLSWRPRNPKAVLFDLRMSLAVGFLIGIIWVTL